MAYILCLAYVIIVYVRPGELVPEWAGLPIALVAGLVAAVGAALSVVLKPRPVAESPIDWCFLGFLVASVVSNPGNGWFGGGSLAFFDLLPLACFYFLIRVTVRTSRQIRGLVLVLILLGMFQAVNGIVQYRTGTGIGGSTAILDRASVADDEEEVHEIHRIRGTGIFNDPNDLAMSMLVVFPFLFTMVLSPDPGKVRRLFGCASAGTLGYALVLTQSRGGFVGFGALCAAYVYRRLGRTRGLLLALAIFGIVVGAGSGRGDTLDASEGSAQGRVQAWSAGLEMFKSNPVFGVGYGQFIEHHERVAHNTFVHTLAEIGFPGAFFLVGTYYWFFAGTGSGRNVAGASASPLARDLWASGIGAVACSWFLSRQYIPVLYLPVALGACRITVEQAGTADAPVLMRSGDWVRLLFTTCGVVVAVYVSVRVLAIWSH
jgi:putative inorganic carbon (HCO3(-)) transporter